MKKSNTYDQTVECRTGPEIMIVLTTVIFVLRLNLIALAYQ